MRSLLVRLAVIGAFVVLLQLSPMLLVTIAVADKPADLPPFAPADRSAAFDSIRTDLGDYIWPTDASTKITSSFAEYRSTHFHGGIDISTNGQTGYRAFAVRDGEVYKVTIAANGYGKMLYLRHADGYVSTYAHLKGFNERITRAVRAEQLRRGTYPVDLTFAPGEIRVKKGETVAYTGDTGFGPPHLHYELRDENLNPVNPMLCPSYAARDGIAPMIRRMMVEPLDAASTVEQGSTPRYYSRFPGGRGGLKLPQTLRLHGRIGFGIEAQDRSEGTWTRSGIHRMELYIDDRMTYAMQLDRVPMLDTKMILLHYDLPTIRDGKGKFQKLYVDQGNDLPIYGRLRPGAGVITTDELSEGLHTFRVVCMDISGNRTSLSGSFIANHRPEFRVHRMSDDEITLGAKYLPPIATAIVSGKANFSPVWSQHTIPASRIEQDGTGAELPIDTRKYDVVRIVLETKAGSRSAPLFHFLKKPSGPAHAVLIDHAVQGGNLRVKLTTAGAFTEAPTATIVEGGVARPIPLEAVDLSTYAGVLSLGDAAGARQIRVSAEVNGKPSIADEEFTVYAVPTSKAGSFRVPGGLAFSYDSGAVYAPLFLRVRSEEEGKGTVHTLEPQDELLRRGLTVSVPVSPAREREGLGLYLRTTGGWVYQTGTPDQGGRSYSTTLTRTLGELALFNDNVRPTIGRLKVLPRGGRLYVAFRYHDNLSGVDAEEIKLYIDGQPAIPEIDGERKRVWYDADELLARGKHTLRVTVRDRAGNITSENRTFSVR